MVREKGLEPPRPKAPDPKSGASAIPPLAYPQSASLLLAYIMTKKEAEFSLPGGGMNLINTHDMIYKGGKRILFPVSILFARRWM